MWTPYKRFVALLMVVTGSINTLSTKWADTIEAKGIDGQTRSFSHPFVQSVCMFMGEMLCLLAFKVLFFRLKRRQDGSENTNELTRGNRNFNPFILFIPAMCDMTATSIMYIGLNLTYASSFQMLRGSVIIFVGILSVGFLNRILVKREWTGIFFIICGLAVVGMSDFLTGTDKSYTRNNIITGDLLIIIAQIITSVQMVYEERYVSGMDIPALQAIGWEGVFGFSVLSCLLLPLYFIHVGPPFNHNASGTLENVLDALTQITNSPLLVVALSGTIVSIAFFNYAGISLTKDFSATTRMVFDSVRTLVVWMAALALGWQSFHGLQVLGFAALVFGMLLYNNVFVLQFYKRMVRAYRNRMNGGGDPMTENIVDREAGEIDA